MVVLHVRLEVHREFVDTGRQKRNLHFGRSCVVGTARELRHDIGLLDSCN
jgi:hypothetical protein